MILYYHPLSSYCWKVLIALYENETPFERRMMEEPGVAEAWLALWPIGKFPVLRAEARGQTVAEASIIIEYLGQQCPGPFRPLPEDPAEALEVRLMDRLFDNYVMTPMQKIVADRLRAEDARDVQGVGEARILLGKAYAMLEERIGARRWAAGDDFTLADCAAAPALFYADKVEPMRGGFPALAAYLDRLEARASFARVLEEKQPWWPMFPYAGG
ncbi:glutathione S-transferase [Sphingobium quisquiliarum P25]|uniref:Glutathione S-transferase n=1 Tax=Sphingobium quisquiliarum P25 TaxID=1329909 RepID=T0HU18_9SPHN|nr:glutathione S-transferase C-terminal domain-containing protein [Sphingobium quisquiliarum]EQB02785.1 glutathione S-transferase [Sphingobium quisquiliarum P25]EZP73542.1 Glutathione S-transferase [Sphingomonas paucimobilis]